MIETCEIYDEVAYVYDGSLEGLLSAIFAAYANREDPSEVCAKSVHQPRLAQRVYDVPTDVSHAERVQAGLVRKAGASAFCAVRKAAVSSQYDAGTAAYRFVRYAMDIHKGDMQPISNIAHPCVEPILSIAKAVDGECEHMRQFIRFQHLKGDGAEIWFARCNPRDSVVPLVMNHFVQRFNVQPFIIFDEVHHVSGVYDGKRWYLVPTNIEHEADLHLPGSCADEAIMQDAWRRFYKCVSIDARYNPELRRNFMPKRFWKNLTEMQEEQHGLRRG